MGFRTVEDQNKINELYHDVPDTYQVSLIELYNIQNDPIFFRFDEEVLAIPLVETSCRCQPELIVMIT